MVNYSLPILTLLALSASTVAIPTTGTTSGTTFTFAQWIEDIIANPGGNHLTPEEAVAAKKAAIATTNPLNARAPRCDGLGWPRANVRFKSSCKPSFHADNVYFQANDAAACLQYLANKGAQGINCGIGENQFDIQMCQIGNAQVHSSKSTSTAQGANW
jgi:hypothetical protein